MRELNLIDKAFFLKKTTLFGSLDLDLLLSIADKMEMLHFRPSDIIFSPEQDAHRMYLILKGHILITDRTGSQLEELEAGDFFGDEALFTERLRTYSASCKTKVELLSLPRSHLLSIIHECPTVAISLLECYTAKITFRPR